MTTQRLYVFDAYGTLFDVHSAIGRHASDIGPNWKNLSELWRTKQLEYSWVHGLMDRYLDFWELTERALDFAIAKTPGIDTGLRGRLLEAYENLAVFPDVLVLLDALKEREAQMAILSNANRKMLDDAVSSAGLAGYFHAVLSVEPVRRFKPDSRVYDLVDDAFGAARKDVAFQSSNAWDAAGAAAYGFDVHWVNRGKAPREYPEIAGVSPIDDLAQLIPPP